MADTSSPTEPDINELQKEIIQSIEYFAQINRIRVEDNNFIQEKINQISEQRVIFLNFVEESISQSLKMCYHAKNLIVFAEWCENDGTNKEDLLEYLRSLLGDSKLHKSEATLLKKQIENIKNSLGGIAREISEYNDKITKERKDLSDGINKANKLTDDAKSIAKRVTGIGLIAAVLAAPFTGGVSLIVSVTFAVENLTIITATNTVCNAVARWSAAASSNLNYKLQGVREEFSQYLRVMHNGLDNIINIISHCEFYWERQIVEIEDIIIKLERGEQRMNKLISRNVLAKAKKTRANSEGYSFNMRQAINRD
ncbi:uncharacterized protein OCT59_017315 [Rhizophagus irregularis]|uniref:Uncharacterized protein n=3 Tax=Rhizophagus irregularis TaxID=588596 RepID=A0A015JWU7_RHIIW|nr:hypothetical protein GLOIN_2v1721241 [Rhizophagus irregularis DAOM 181602=DAOM 197198]EXX59563.1 hypothetical protein RirG_187940 [Rhizophagus irregularis DAOM 197198w]UZO25026.1 hypothetical protein OCT59_017315 [Rhizophagus irregularis]EXX59564.1 hypothetical protein RirG_187940 [Rhizophagus irregularis DAOM 197198w]POG59576.1 hypothetical protein GLOIN_2v1721241 [Rhizophagus irregularis DAOM 181602=DAOM 197198]CAG8494558.1 18578_t:CDS:2 [Rhizophagus irregularis]|eukprot:XP_025166442.1 hypothetical protein GLOIN_2v1721241 [Rhizophagus irregularis DAOM 181602=DAOM 197198]